MLAVSPASSGEMKPFDVPFLSMILGFCGQKNNF